MATICFEVARLTVNDAYKEDPSIAEPAFDILSKVNGLTSAFQGLDLEIPRDLFLFQEWESIQHHFDFQADAPTYSKLLEVVTQFTLDVKLSHVNFVDNPRACLSAPVSELITWSLKKGVEAEAVIGYLRNLIRMLKLLPSGRRIGYGAYGQVVEDERLLVVVLGWDSTEARVNALIDPTVEQLLVQLRGLADPEPRVLHLTAFKL